MTDRRPSKAQLERRLERIRREYEAASARLTEVGFICEGSLQELYTSCGNPNCRCADPEHRHGPYWQLTWKEHGKTVTRRLTPDPAGVKAATLADPQDVEHVCPCRQQSNYGHRPHGVGRQRIQFGYVLDGIA